MENGTIFLKLKEVYIYFVDMFMLHLNKKSVKWSDLAQIATS